MNKMIIDIVGIWSSPIYLIDTNMVWYYSVAKNVAWKVKVRAPKGNDI